MDSETPINIDFYTLFSSEKMRDEISTELITKLIDIYDDINTDITVYPISPYTRSIKYKLSHHTQRRIKSIIGKELKASSMQLGVSYYVVESHNGTKDALKFLRSISEYDTPLTESQLLFELESIESDVDMKHEYITAYDNRDFVDTITTNTNKYRSMIRNSTAYNTKITQMPYFVINDQPITINSADDLTKSAMKQFFTEHIKKHDTDDDDTRQQ